MENHSYVASNFGISLLYKEETFLIAYDYAYEEWRIIHVCYLGQGVSQVFKYNNVSNINPWD